MKTVAAVYTSLSQVETVKKLFAEIAPHYKLYHIIEERMIKDVMDAGYPTDAVVKRLSNYFHAAAATEANVIVLVCSSVGNVVTELQKSIPVPIIRIDAAMMHEALSYGSRIGMLASLKSTLAPSIAHLRDVAQKEGKRISVLECVAEGAHPALLAKDFARHDELVLNGAKKLADKVDVIVLAQASLSRMEDSLAKSIGKPVLSSPRSGILSVCNYLESI
jgi:Asp/Glu/hydantoin racemase